jgi:diphthamide biosynthesis methyltransferase
MQAFDLAFCHAGAGDVSFLLLVKVCTVLAKLHRDETHCSIKAVLVLLAGLRNPAVSRVEDLLKLEPDEPLHHLVLVGRVSGGLLR